MQVASQQIWGAIAFGGAFPTVKAYHGPLPTGARGVEFTTMVVPFRNFHPNLELWLENDPGVQDMGNGYVGIDANVYRNTQV